MAVSTPSAAAERDRAADPEWRFWGPYVAARQWGTVREDYSADGDAWAYLPFEQSHARAYRWGEDGLGAICDRWQFLCFGLALWNGRDPILKERPFGLSNAQGNHGEDAKDYWWTLDDTPTHSYSRFLYRYPQAEFPYAQLRSANAGRSKEDREFELADTGVLAENRFFDVTVTYAKAAPRDIAIVIEATNHGPDPAPLHVLPTAWFRNTWAWGRDPRRPELTAADGQVRCSHATIGDYVLAAEDAPEILVTDNETNNAALFGSANASDFTKDGIGEHVIRGADTVNPTGRGTKAAFWYRWDAIGPGETVRIRLRLAATPGKRGRFGRSFDTAVAQRRAETDAFYADVLGDAAPAEAEVARRAFSGLLWSTKLYRYSVPVWLDGDPTGPPPPAERQSASGRNVRWKHLDLAEILSLPDEWEYPWFAAWDLAFHTLALAYVDPEFAKSQLIIMCREWLMHPDGQLPAYEWNFGDVNPPVHAWASLRVFLIDAARTGKPDYEFLERIFHKQLLTFSWWVNRKDPDGSNLFEGGFLGMDNIGPFDRSAPPAGWRLEESDATSWMALFCLSMLRMAFELARQDRAYADTATKFFEHFLSMAQAASSFGTGSPGLWDDEDGFCYDVLSRDGDAPVRLRVRSMSGLLPLAAAATIEEWVWDELPAFASRVAWLMKRHPERTEHCYHDDPRGQQARQLLSLLTPAQVLRVAERLLDEGEFLSPHGVRSVSAAHRGGAKITVDGAQMSVDYEPAESRTGLFGGNSNWRGPVWFPVNVMLVDALRHYDDYDPQLRVELPTGSGNHVSLAAAADEIERRLIGLFLPGPTGRRPGAQRDHGDGPLWDHPTFSEYFHGDTGEGLGASHQTGWTSLVAALIADRARR
jgi:hypothetical protein